MFAIHTCKHKHCRTGDPPTDLDTVWEKLLPAEQQRVAEVLIESVVVTTTETVLTLRMESLQTAIKELGAAVAGKASEAVSERKPSSKSKAPIRKNASAWIAAVAKAKFGESGPRIASAVG